MEITIMFLCSFFFRQESVVHPCHRGVAIQVFLFGVYSCILIFCLLFCKLEVFAIIKDLAHKVRTLLAFVVSSGHFWWIWEFCVPFLLVCRVFWRWLRPGIEFLM